MVPLPTFCIPVPFLACSQHPAPSQALSHSSPSHFHCLSHYQPSLGAPRWCCPPVVAEGARVARSPGRVLLETHLPPNLHPPGRGQGSQKAVSRDGTNLLDRTIAPSPPTPLYPRSNSGPSLAFCVYAAFWSPGRVEWVPARTGARQPRAQPHLHGPGLEGLAQRRWELSSSPLPLRGQEGAGGGGGAAAGAHQFRSHLLCSWEGGREGGGRGGAGVRESIRLLSQEKFAHCSGLSERRKAPGRWASRTLGRWK